MGPGSGFGTVLTVADRVPKGVKRCNIDHFMLKTQVKPVGYLTPLLARVPETVIPSSDSYSPFCQ